MPATVPELISDLPDFLALYTSVKAAIDGLPAPGQRTAADYAKAFGATAGSPLALTAALIDKLDEQIKS